MVLKNVVLCRDVIDFNMGDGEVPGIIGPHAAIGLEVVPTQFSFAVSFIIEGASPDGGKMELNLYSPDQRILANPYVEIPPKNPTDRMEEFVVNLKLNNILFKSEGQYRFSVVFEGKHLGDHKFNVVKLKETEEHAEGVK